MTGTRVVVALAATVIGCTPSIEPQTTCSEGAAPGRPLFVLESDEGASSAVARVETSGCATERPSVVLGADPALAWSSGRAFVCVRDRSRVVEIDPLDATIVDGHEWTVPPADAITNPHDVAVAPDGTLWITRFNGTALAVLHPDGSPAADVELGSLADADGIPEMDGVAIASGRAYVALERLTEVTTGKWWPAEQPSYLAVIDVATRKLLPEATITLAGRNPWGRLVPDPADPQALYVVEPGDFDAVDARDGIERVDLATGIGAQVVDETKLGGSVSDLVIASATEAYAIVASPAPGNPTSLVRLDPSSGHVDAPLATDPGYTLWGVALAGDSVAVGERDPAGPRIRLFARASGSERPSVALGVLPPVALIGL